MRFLLGGILAAFLVGCSNQGDDRLKEKAGIEGREQAEQQQKILDERSRRMEQDLTERQNFFRALEGIFEGVIQETNVKVRFVFTPNRPIYYPSDRIRTNEEVADDLLNLSFESYVSLQFQEYPDIPPSDCLVSNIRPDLVRGFVKVSSEESDCPNRFHILVAETFLNRRPDAEVHALDIARQALGGEVDEFKVLNVRNFSANGPEIYQFKMERVD